MAKEKLTDLIEWLRRDDKNRFEIYDLDRNESIEKCASYEELSARYGDPMAYFENLVTRGINTVQIVKKRRNGNTYVRDKSCGLNFSLSTGTEANNNVAASGLSGFPAATTQQPAGLAGAHTGSGSFGLGFPEIMAIGSRADRYEDAKKENEELKLRIKEVEAENKTKIEHLEAENKRLETECLKHQFGIESKPSALDKLLEGIASNPAALPQIIQSFKGGTPGLNSPQLEASKKELSDTKSTVVDLISNNQQLDDDTVGASYYILIEGLKGNQKFMDEYLQLLYKHKILDNGSDGNSYSNE